MKRLTVTLLLASCFVSACNYSASFDQKVWAESFSVSETHNPRARMVDDLMQHKLQSGMSRQAIVRLLGKPYSDGIQQRLPKGTVIPDSISITSTDNLKPENQEKALARFNEYYHSHSQPDTLMLYPAGWSIIDPNFLAIEFSGKGKVRAYWIEEH